MQIGEQSDFKRGSKRAGIVVKHNGNNYLIDHGLVVRPGSDKHKDALMADPGKRRVVRLKHLKVSEKNEIPYYDPITVDYGYAFLPTERCAVPVIDIPEISPTPVPKIANLLQTNADGKLQPPPLIQVQDIALRSLRVKKASLQPHTLPDQQALDIRNGSSTVKTPPNSRYRKFWQSGTGALAHNKVKSTPKSHKTNTGTSDAGFPATKGCRSDKLDILAGYIATVQLPLETEQQDNSDTEAEIQAFSTLGNFIYQSSPVSQPLVAGPLGISHTSVGLVAGSSGNPTLVPVLESTMTSYNSVGFDCPRLPLFLHEMLDD